MKVPKWAQDLILDTLLYLQSRGYPDAIPEIRWRHSSYHKLSSGVCYQHNHITITAGKDRRDQKLVLLHELAHWVLPDKEHHGDAFWRLAFELYRVNKLPIRVCINRESTSTHRRSRARIVKLAKESK
jgi:hypothetical protein